MTSFIEINARRIGPGYPTYIVAEMSANHNQNFEQAIKIVEAAKEAGADAIKIQTYTPDTITIDCDNEYFRVKGTIWDGRTLYDLYGEAYTPWDWQPKLKEIANTGPRSVLVALRRDRCGLPGGHARPGLQSRVVRERGHPIAAENRRHR